MTFKYEPTNSSLLFSLRKAAAVVLTAAALAVFAPAAHANLVINGSFETVTVNNAQLGYNTTATGWSTTGYNFVFQSGAADTLGQRVFFLFECFDLAVPLGKNLSNY